MAQESQTSFWFPPHLFSQIKRGDKKKANFIVICKFFESSVSKLTTFWKVAKSFLTILMLEITSCDPWTPRMDFKAADRNRSIPIVDINIVCFSKERRALSQKWNSEARMSSPLHHTLVVDDNFARKVGDFVLNYVTRMSVILPEMGGRTISQKLKLESINIFF